MTYAQMSGSGMVMISAPLHALAAAVSTSFPPTIDATGEKIAIVGRVWFKERTSTKNISRVGFRFGTVTKAGGSALTVSLQDIDSTAGPIRPDGTQDQTVAIANADSSFSSNTWCRTGALSANRTVTFGDVVCVVIEFDGSGRLGSDSIEISCFNAGTTQFYIDDYSPFGVNSFASSAWSATSRTPNIVLEFDDGSFGTLDGSIVYSAFGSQAFNSGSTPDEYALEFAVDAKCKIDALYIGPHQIGNSSANYDVVLYNGTTALATVSVDANEVNTTYRPGRFLIPEQELTTGNTYRLALKPTTANNITFQYLDLASASHRVIYPFGVNAGLNTRTDAGSWGTINTTRLPIGWGVRVSSIDDGAGGGGGGSVAIPVSGRMCSP